MKTSKKVLSVILAIIMTLSVCNCAIVSFAAASGVSESQYSVLADALRNPTVATACANHKGSTNDYTVDDPDGSVLAAAEAYWAVVSGLYDSSANQNNTTTRNLKLIKGQILTNLQDSSLTSNALNAEEIAQAAAIINVFAADTDVSDSTNAGSGAANPTVNLTVNLGENAILQYDSISDMPENIVIAKTFSMTHSKQSYFASFSFRYYIKASGISTSETTKAKSDFETYSNVFAKYDDLYTADLATLVAMDASEINSIVAELNGAYDEVAEAFSTAVLNKFYGEYAAAVEAFLPKLETAKEIQDTNATVVAAINEAVANVDSTTDRAELAALKSTITTNLNSYNAKSDAVKDYIALDVTAVNAAVNKIQNKIDLIDVADAYEALNTAMASADRYKDYTTEAAANGDYDAESGDIKIAAETLNAPLSTLKAIKSTNEAALIEVIGADYADYLDDAQAQADSINSVSAAAGYSADLKNFIDTITAEYSEDSGKTESQNAMAKADFYKGVATSLNEYTANIPEGVDPELAAVSIDLAKKRVNKVIEEINASLTATIKAELKEAKVLFESVSEEYDAEISLASLSSFKDLKKAIGGIETDLYEYCVNNGLIGEDEIAVYNDINSAGIIDKYEAFVAAGGFNVYKQTSIDDIVRAPAAMDLIRDKDYVVDDEKVEEIIKLLERALKSKEIKSLGVDVETALNGLPDMLYGAICNDKTFNSIIKLIFPTVTDLIIPIWETVLPDTFEANVDVLGHIDGTLTIYDIETCLNAINVSLFPKQIAADIEEKYPEVAAVLNAIETETSYSVVIDEVTGEEVGIISNPWKDASIYDEDGNLNLVWGITDKDSFIAAFSAVAKSLEPVLVAILGNTAATIKGSSLGTAWVREISLGFWKFDVTVHQLQLVAKIGAGDGFNNVLAPIFEALGLSKDEIPDGKDFETTDDILYALFGCVDLVLEKFAERPIEFILEALPNLSYALESGNLQALLGMLEFSLSVKAGVPSDGQISSSSSAAAGILNTAKGALGDFLDLASMIPGFPSVLNIGELVKLEKFGITDLNSILELVLGLLNADINLPKIDGVTLATLGKLVEKDTRRDAKSYEWGTEGKAAYIEANKADVLIFILRYVLKAAQDPDFIPSIVALFGDGAVELPKIVEEIITNITTNSDDAIAAIVELVYPQAYSAADELINWIITEDDGEPNVRYMTQAWTKSKAQYIVDNFPSFIDNIIMIAGVKVGDSEMLKSLPEVLDNLVAELYTADTVNKIAAELSGLIAGLNDKLDTDIDVMGLIGDILDIDLTYWDNYHADFEGSDKAAFTAALQDVLKPLEGVIKFIVAGENLTAKLSDENGKFKLVEIQGYESYSYGIVPLLEALGATNVMTPDEFLADTDNIVSNLINEVLSAVDHLIENPYDNTLDLLLNLVYFIASDGVTAVIDNVLHSVDALFELIRPIYDISLNDIVDFDIRFAQQDILTFLFTTVNKVIYEKTGIEIKYDFSAEQVLSDLAFGDVEEFTSANGETAYRVTKVSDDAADLLTVLGRFVIRQLIFSENAVAYADIAKEKFDLDDFSYRSLKTFLSLLAQIQDGPDYVLGVIFYIFYGADKVVDAAADYYKYYAYDWQEIIAHMQDSETDFIEKAGYLLKEIYEKTFNPIVNDLDQPIQEDIRAIEKFFRGILNWFKMVWDLFKDIFVRN